MSRYIDPTPKYTDASNEPFPNGLLYFYESGTNTQKTTYADINQTIANPHPLVLNGDGSVPNCFYSGAAKVVLADSNDVQQWERDPVVGSETSSFGDSWDAISVYGLNDVVTFNNLLYVSIAENNQNNNPASAPEFWTQFDLLKRWNVNETYQVRDPVIATDFTIYLSLTANNQGNDPLSSPANWVASGVASGGILAFNQWDSSITYEEGGANIVTASDDNYYVSISNGNINRNPISQPAFWTQISHIRGGNIVIDDKNISSTTTDSDIDITPDGVGKLTYNGIEVAEANDISGLQGQIDTNATNITSLDNAKAGIADNENITGAWEWQDNISARFGNGADVEVLYDSALNAFKIDLSSSADFIVQDNGTTVLQYDNSAQKFIFNNDIDVDVNDNYMWGGRKVLGWCSFDMGAQTVDGDRGIAGVQAGQPGGAGTIDINLSTAVGSTSKAIVIPGINSGLGPSGLTVNYLWINTSRVRILTSTLGGVYNDWFGSVLIIDGGA